MKSRNWIGLLLLILVGCGDSGRGAARTAGELCGEICGWPDECFLALGVPAQGAECMQSCEAQVEVVGVACLQAISNTVSCLGTCDLTMVTNEQALNCQDEALAIESSCE